MKLIEIYKGFDITTTVKEGEIVITKKLSK